MTLGAMQAAAPQGRAPTQAPPLPPLTPAGPTAPDQRLENKDVWAAGAAAPAKLLCQALTRRGIDATWTRCKMCPETYLGIGLETHLSGKPHWKRVWQFRKYDKWPTDLSPYIQTWTAANGERYAYNHVTWQHGPVAPEAPAHTTASSSAQTPREPVPPRGPPPPPPPPYSPSQAPTEEHTNMDTDQQEKARCLPAGDGPRRRRSPDAARGTHDQHHPP